MSIFFLHFLEATMFFKENLRLLTSSSVCNQNQLSKKLGCTRQTISCYLSGKAEPSLKKLIIISEIYSVTIDDLLKTDLSSQK